MATTVDLVLDEIARLSLEDQEWLMRSGTSGLSRADGKKYIALI